MVGGVMPKCAARGECFARKARSSVRTRSLAGFLVPQRKRHDTKPFKYKGFKWRRGWDSNPRSVSRLRFSRPAQSTTLPPLRWNELCGNGKRYAPLRRVFQAKSARASLRGCLIRPKSGDLFASERLTKNRHEARSGNGDQRSASKRASLSYFRKEFGS